MIDEDFLVDLYEADEQLISGNPDGMKRLLPRMKNEEYYCQIPVVFYVAKSYESLNFLSKNNVNLLQKSRLTGDSLLHRLTFDGDDAVFKWVVNWFGERNLIDEINHDGISSLSAALKMGLIGRARNLVSSGASMTSVAKNGLNPVRQATMCISGEAESIAGLNMLFENGLRITQNELNDLQCVARTLKRNRVALFLENLLDAV